MNNLFRTQLKAKQKKSSKRCSSFLILMFQAGEKHYHPQCSRCARCHGVFGEGQEMFLQGKKICAKLPLRVNLFTKYLC